MNTSPTRAARLLRAEIQARQVGRVILVGSGRRVVSGIGGIYDALDENNALLLRLAAEDPARLGAFVALDPQDHHVSPSLLQATPCPRRHR